MNAKARVFYFFQPFLGSLIVWYGLVDSVDPFLYTGLAACVFAGITGLFCGLMVLFVVDKLRFRLAASIKYIYFGGRSEKIKFTSLVLLGGLILGVYFFLSYEEADSFTATCLLYAMFLYFLNTASVIHYGSLLSNWLSNDDEVSVLDTNSL